MFRSSDHHQGVVFLYLAKVTLKATLKLWQHACRHDATLPY